MTWGRHQVDRFEKVRSANKPLRAGKMPDFPDAGKVGKCASNTGSQTVLAKLPIAATVQTSKPFDQAFQIFQLFRWAIGIGQAAAQFLQNFPRPLDIDIFGDFDGKTGVRPAGTAQTP